MDTVLSLDWIVTNPDVRDGKPCISGTGLRVIDVVSAHLFYHLNADEIAVQYDVPLAGIYAALAYYYQNKAEIDAVIRTEKEAFARMKAEWQAHGGAPLLP
jgi:uncharacterized protein (DUF433 family)